MFRFRLQTLLRLRMAERDQRRADLAKAIRAEQMLRDQQQQLANERDDLTGRGRRLKAPGSADVDALLQTHRYELVLTAKARQLTTQIEQITVESERRRLALVEADRQVHVLEKLRDRQALAERQSQERLEHKELDEVASLNFLRRREAP
jgi:flagellar protein FliJ